MHRPPPEMLLDHASGALPASMSLAIAAHASLCPDTRAEIARFEQLGGALLDNLDPATLRESALARTLAQLDAPVPGRRAIEVTEATKALLPPPLWPWVKGDVQRIRWRRVGPGIESAAVMTGRGGESAFFLRVAAGRAVPMHTHAGLELTLVLAGSYRDGDHLFARGSIQVTDQTIVHAPIADPGEDCVCFVALSAAIRLTGPVGRYFNAFVRL